MIPLFELNDTGVAPAAERHSFARKPALHKQRGYIEVLWLSAICVIKTLLWVRVRCRGKYHTRRLRVFCCR